MKKKLLALVLVVVLAVTAVVGGTMAYLTDTDEAVNVMTLGNVQIEQLEYERVVENGAWVSTGETDKYGYTPDKVQEFTQAKPLYPAVFTDGDIKWDDRNGSTAASGEGSHQQSWAQVGASGSNQLFDDSVKNVQDKFVFVENTGKSDAYVRTLFAFELGSIAYNNFNDVIQMNANPTHWSWNWLTTSVNINGNEYMIAEAVYNGPASNPTGILAPGAVSYPSLLQVYMKPATTNEDVEALDGNNNGTYDILVLSQAIQTAGFSDAQTALNAGFGEVNAANVQSWFGSSSVPTTVSTADELAEALAAGDSVVLAEDINMADEDVAVAAGTVLDLNGNNLNISWLYSEDEGEVTIKNGTIALNADEDDGSYGVYLYAMANQTLTLEDVTINDEGLSVYADADGVVVLTNVTLANTSTSNPVQSFGGTMILNNVTVAQSGDATSAWYSSAIQVVNMLDYSTKTITDQAEVTVNGGSYTGKRAIQVSAPGGNVTVNGGTFTGSEYALKAEYAPGNYNGTSESVITINGGIFNGKIVASAATQLTINGGTFINSGLTVEQLSAYVGEGHTVIENTDGSYTVQ